MAQNLSGLAITSPATDPNIDESGTFSFEITPSFAGGGVVNAYDLTFEYDQGTGSWTAIPSSSGGLTAPTSSFPSLTTTSPTSITVTGVTADVYSIRVTNTSRAITSGTQTVTVNVAVATPTLTLPTETNITGTTATVGCTTDQGTGTLYWYVSTSATAPSAANLKSGSGAVDFGNQTSPGVGTETFSVTGLSQSTAYYTYFIHNNASGDSNILESGIWYTQEVLTADDLQSVTNVSTPAVAQEHVLLADDLQSLLQSSSPNIAQEHVLLADDLDSTSEVTQPVVAIITPLLADDLESTSEASQPNVGQEHALLADDLDSTSEVTSPTVVDVNTTENLLADDLQSAAQMSTPVFEEYTYVLTPDADSNVGNWETHTGATTNLYQQIDEVTPNDTDYIRSEINPNTSPCRIGLSSPAGSVNPSAQHYIRYRYRKADPAGQTVDLTVKLIEGASTVIASWTHTDVSDTNVTSQQILTAPQVANISDYSNLSIEFEANTP